MESDQRKLLIIEPFYGGSHKKMIDIICSNLPEHRYALVTMTAKKWHWRARTSALYISMQIPYNHHFKILFCTSVLPLAELLGLRPDLVNLHKVVYFHENQLDFPVQVTKERDFQYGFNEILTCLAADKVLFNSCYNQDSFLSHINKHMKIQPDYKIMNIDQTLHSKCEVIYYPLDLAAIDLCLSSMRKETVHGLHIVWPHRWEFDKNPEAFYNVLCKLNDDGLDYKVSILGETFNEKPDIFSGLLNKFHSKLLHYGYLDNAEDYYKVLWNADVVVSTALHEFFGVAILEAVYCGCIPVVPKRLSYKELFEGKVDEIYENEEQLYLILRDLCTKKLHGTLTKDYRHLALPFESSKWCNLLVETFNCKFT